MRRQVNKTHEWPELTPGRVVAVSTESWSDPAMVVEAYLPHVDEWVLSRKIQRSKVGHLSPAGMFTFVGQKPERVVRIRDTGQSTDVYHTGLAENPGPIRQPYQRKKLDDRFGKAWYDVLRALDFKKPQTERTISKKAGVSLKVTDEILEELTGWEVEQVWHGNTWKYLLTDEGGELILRRRGATKNPVELETTGYMSSRNLDEGDEPWTIRYEIKDRAQSWGDYDVPVHVIEHATGSDYSGGLVTRSNYEAIQEMVDEDDELKPYVIYFYGGHGTYGVAIRLDQGDVPDELLEVVGALSDYPLLDEDRHSRMEMEAEDEAWDSFGREEWRDALKSEFPDQEDELDEMSDAKLDALWHEASSNIGWHAQHDVEGVTFNFDDAVEEVDFED